ncbi:hypothetical protein BDV32DRAFT_148518 [Aspergillus pseudonomiae]|uniref:Beta-ketoacyl synthase-like N-terminal domain-containing protein n=1 Tax=Aspergillus pseudonomiae TaxID=1506151 RepID=A0A5N7CV74_9EURO|nr:uncharacterized protein BDV37DRAFT_288817 [Aspergillus pseudonomiae]KAB8261556.1 hypothetical protein BDV32DRAFT_148518 [Aspergillus pseudonomiae]KAE8398106.1 hypothetical protein BDV37DRAFT_288817 [Aspergillus pseudonomiae]
MAYHYHYNNKNINISEAMDPQLRLLLEVIYEAFENGGFTLDRLKGGNASVYTALYNKDYEKIFMRDQEELPESYIVTGNGEATYSNRLSYFFDLKGPSFPLDTGPIYCGDAFRKIQMGKHAGKLVLSYSDSDVIKVAPPLVTTNCIESG